MDQKPLLVIFEGRDKAGKSTLYQAYRRATNYQPFAVDRFIGSNIVYDQVYSRRVTLPEEYYQMEENLCGLFRPVVIFVDAPTAVLLKRAADAGTYKEEAEDIKAAKRFYEDYIQRTPFPVIEINSSAQNIKACVRTILSEIEKLEDENVWEE